MGQDEGFNEKYVLKTECVKIMKDNEGMVNKFSDRLENLTEGVDDVLEAVGKLQVIEERVDWIKEKIDSYNDFRTRVARLEGLVEGKDDNLGTQVARLEERKKSGDKKADRKTKVIVALIAGMCALLGALISLIAAWIST